MKSETLDLLIIGHGPAGYAASIYAKRMGLRTLVIGSEPGGLIAKTHLVENWPGEPSLTGLELAQKLKNHAETAGADLRFGTIKNIVKNKDGSFTATPRRGDPIHTKAILLATGSKPKKLGVKGEEELAGRGVSYCATCDGAFYKNQDVVVIGGSDSAAKEALMLSEICKSVKILYRKEHIRAEPINANRVAKNDKIEIIPFAEVSEFIGNENGLQKIILKDKRDKNTKNSERHARETIFSDQASGKSSGVGFSTTAKEVICTGAFIEIGHDPQSDLAAQLGADIDDSGHIKVNLRTQNTNIPFLYAAGDCTDDPEKQAIIAAACGVRAVLRYFKEKG